MNMTYPMCKYLFQANKNDSTAICKCDLQVFFIADCEKLFAKWVNQYFPYETNC